MNIIHYKGWFKNTANFVKVCEWLKGHYKGHKIDQNENSGDQKSQYQPNASVFI